MLREATTAWRRLVRIIAPALILVILVAFVLDNRQSVRGGFVLFERQAPLIGIFLATAALGAVADLRLRWRAR